MLNRNKDMISMLATQGEEFCTFYGSQNNQFCGNRLSEG